MTSPPPNSWAKQQTAKPRQISDKNILEIDCNSWTNFKFDANAMTRNTKNTENTENKESTENTENTDNTENTKNTENTEN